VVACYCCCCCCCSRWQLSLYWHSLVVVCQRIWMNDGSSCSAESILFHRVKKKLYSKKLKLHQTVVYFVVRTFRKRKVLCVSSVYTPSTLVSIHVY
jgi:hypothetical protein